MATASALEACQRRKRKPTVFEFEEFGRPGSVINLLGPFRDNVRLFLQEHGQIEDHSVSGLPTWSISLSSQSSDVVFPLYIIEEPVQHSLHPFCIHCRCVGWSHHFLCKRRYHFIIPTGSKWNKPLKGNCLELRTHLLYGLIHCNGFGHLLTVNSLQEGSNFLSGNNLMELWDRICTSLRTRKISLTDFSRKKSMELRLIHGVAYGNTWFGKWGYKFGRGSFGVTEDKYERAVRFLASVGLDKIINDFKNTDQGRKLEQIVRYYRGAHETPLISIGDLLQFMLGFKSITQKESRKTVVCSRKILKDESRIVENAVDFEEFVCTLANADCRWSQRRLEHTLSVVVDLLQENEVMSRQELRDHARLCIGDTGLIDFLLKSISCFRVENQIVCREVNPETKVAEFRIEDVVDEAKSVRYFATSLVNLESRWPEQRVEQTAQVVVKILKENKAMNNGNGAMSRQELRNAARQCVGDTGLIDFVLKSINNSVIGSQVVCRAKNPLTRLIEFAIHDHQNELELPSLNAEAVESVCEDCLFLYKNVLLGYPEYDPVSLASQVILDSKHLVKEWVFKEEDGQLMTLTCRVLPSFDELETELTRPLPPGEMVMVPPWMTISELKVVAQCALRDTYCVMERFEVRQIGGLKGLEDEMLLAYAVESGAHVWVRGRGLDLDTKLRYEGGPENGRVDCVCGAKDDDGERMVACDACHVWLHTRCSDIDDDDDDLVHSFFLCANCRGRR